MTAFANNSGIVSSLLRQTSKSTRCSRPSQSPSCSPFIGNWYVASRGISVLPLEHKRACLSESFHSRHVSTGPMMTLGKVVVAGGTGFVGSRLVRALVAKGADVTVLTRSQSSARHLPAKVTARVWTPDQETAVGDMSHGWEGVLEGTDLVVNLCGVPVVTRWTDTGKREIKESRVKTNSTLADAIVKMSPGNRPKCFVSASGVGYYGVSDDAIFTEESKPAKNDFLAEVSVAWEEAAKPIADTGVRVAIMRFGVVLGVGGGALARMLPAFKMFVGGPVGSGNQWVSWIHIDDLVNMIIRCGEDTSISGAYNATAPRPVTMGELSASLARSLNRPNLFPVPDFVLKTVLGESASVVLSGQQVLPKRWEKKNFEFAYPDIDSAMTAVAKEA